MNETAVTAKQKIDQMVKPPGSLGKLETALQKIAATLQHIPTSLKRVVVLAGGDHGVSEENVSIAPRAITTYMMHQFHAGKATINSFARSTNTDLAIIDAGVDCDEPFVNTLMTAEGTETIHIEGRDVATIRRATHNFTTQEAMTRAEVEIALARGKALVAELKERGYQLIGLGEMGISNSTSAAAIVSALLKSDEPLVGIGTGVEIEHKAAVVRQALAKHDIADGYEALQKVGGFEIAFLAGVVLGGYESRIPVVVDGVITAAAALSAARIEPNVTDILLGSHLSATEPAQRAVYEALQLDAVLDVHFRLGEGTGAVLAMNVYDVMARAVEEVGELPSF